LPATSLVLSAGAIGSFVGARRISLMVIAILFAAVLASVAFAGERRGLAPADPDGSFRGSAGGQFAYANPENDAVTRTYYGDGVHAPQRDHTVRRTIGGPALSATPMSARSVPNVIGVNGRLVEIVSPDEVNSIDLAVNAPGLEPADLRSARPAASVSASPPLLAQALSVIAGALAALLVGLFLIGRRAVRIPRIELE
jgi:hypothetical protein